jgi:hypothetical protein
MVAFPSQEPYRSFLLPGTCFAERCIVLLYGKKKVGFGTYYTTSLKLMQSTFLSNVVIVSTLY